MLEMRRPVRAAEPGLQLPLLQHDHHAHYEGNLTVEQAAAILGQAFGPDPLDTSISSALVSPEAATTPLPNVASGRTSPLPPSAAQHQHTRFTVAALQAATPAVQRHSRERDLVEYGTQREPTTCDSPAVDCTRRFAQARRFVDSQAAWADANARQEKARCERRKELKISVAVEALLNGSSTDKENAVQVLNEWPADIPNIVPVSTLVAMLQDTSWELRSWAGTNLKEAACDSTRQQCVALEVAKLFGHSNSSVRESGLNALQELNNDHNEAILAVPTEVFVGLLEDTEYDVRSQAIHCLRVHGKDSVQQNGTVARLLEHKNSDVRDGVRLLFDALDIAM